MTWTNPYYGLLRQAVSMFTLSCSCGSWERSSKDREVLYRQHAKHMDTKH